jgi:hypothetical protein
VISPKHDNLYTRFHSIRWKKPRMG